MSTENLRHESLEAEVEVVAEGSSYYCPIHGDVTYIGFSVDNTSRGRGHTGVRMCFDCFVDFWQKQIAKGNVRRALQK